MMGVTCRSFVPVGDRADTSLTGIRDLKSGREVSAVTRRTHRTCGPSVDPSPQEPGTAEDPPGSDGLHQPLRTVTVTRRGVVSTVRVLTDFRPAHFRIHCPQRPDSSPWTHGTRTTHPRHGRRVPTATEDVSPDDDRHTRYSFGLGSHPWYGSEWPCLPSRRTGLRE